MLLPFAEPLLSCVILGDSIPKPSRLYQVFQSSSSAITTGLGHVLNSISSLQRLILTTSYSICYAKRGLLASVVKLEQVHWEITKTSLVFLSRASFGFRIYSSAARLLTFSVKQKHEC